MITLILIVFGLNVINICSTAINNEYGDYYEHEDYDDYDYLNGRSCKPLLSPPKNGRILGICDNRVGQVCNFACNKGFKLKGYASVVCSSSQTWTSNPPVCVPLSCCPKLTPPFRGILEGSCGTNTNVGDKCYAQCETGTVLEGIKVLECLPGCIWNADPPICRSVKPIPVTCPKLYPPLFGSYFGSCSPGIPNRECYFKCSVGYYLVGSNSLTCTESGTWSTSIPYCQKKQTCVGKCCIIPCFG